MPVGSERTVNGKSSRWDRSVHVTARTGSCSLAGRVRPAALYSALFAALAVAFLLPPESLLIDPPWLRYLLAGVVAFAPVFLANLVFTYSFRDTRTADMAFASNLLGAMAGGAMEYVALLTGYRVLLVVVAGLYALAWLFANRWRLLADVSLAAGTQPEAGAWEAETV